MEKIMIGIITILTSIIQLPLIVKPDWACSTILFSQVIMKTIQFQILPSAAMSIMSIIKITVERKILFMRIIVLSAV